jgi:hypothetical protein
MVVVMFVLPGAFELAENQLSPLGLAVSFQPNSRYGPRSYAGKA